MPLRCGSNQVRFLILSLLLFPLKHTMIIVIITKLISLSLAHPPALSPENVKERCSLLHVSKAGCSSWCSEIRQDIWVSGSEEAEVGSIQTRENWAGDWCWEAQEAATDVAATRAVTPFSCAGQDHLDRERADLLPHLPP